MTDRPKKSDKLEVRLPYQTKQAFLRRCRIEGRSASEAVRGFIEDHLARPLITKELPMFVRTPFAYSAIAALAVIGVIVLSASPSRAAPDFAAIFKQIDKNSDGKAVPTELGPDLGGMDSNRDQSVTLAEFTAFNRARLEERFLAFDADRDGKVTPAEVQHANGPMASDDSGKAFVARFDANKDGTMSAAEFLDTP